MKKHIIVKKLFIIVIVVSMFAFTAGTVFASSFVDDKTSKENMLEEFNFTRKIPTLEDDFEDNIVIVTLKSKYSGFNKEIDTQSFKSASLITSIELNEQRQKGSAVDYKT